MKFVLGTMQLEYVNLLSQQLDLSYWITFKYSMLEGSVCILLFSGIINQISPVPQLYYADCRTHKEIRNNDKFMFTDTGLKSNTKHILVILLIFGDSIVLLSMLPLANKLSKSFIVCDNDQLKIFLPLAIFHNPSATHKQCIIQYYGFDMSF